MSSAIQVSGDGGLSLRKQFWPGWKAPILEKALLDIVGFHDSPHCELPTTYPAGVVKSLLPLSS
jgi:hypothetical protein